MQVVRLGRWLTQFRQFLLYVLLCHVEISKVNTEIPFSNKDVCNGGVACSRLLKLASLVCTQTPFFCRKNDVICCCGERHVMPFFDKKRPKNVMMSNWFFDHLQLFCSTIFWSGAKPRFCFRESISVLDQNGRIQALGFLARWRLTSHALYYRIP